MAKKRVQIIKVKNYGMPELNRLAVIADQLAKMESDKERKMAFDWFFGPNGQYKLAAE